MLIAELGVDREAIRQVAFCLFLLYELRRGQRTIIYVHLKELPFLCHHCGNILNLFFLFIYSFLRRSGQAYYIN